VRQPGHGLRRQVRTQPNSEQNDDAGDQLSHLPSSFRQVSA
jgi:hypothetical protein